MTLHVNEVEALWFSVALATFVLTLFALWDAWVARGVVKQLNGHAREIVAAGNLRREVIRLAVQALLLFVVVPGIFTEGATTWTPALAALVAVPVVLLLNSVYDTVDRRRLLGTVAADLVTTSERTLGRIEVAITANTALTQAAADHADHAYREANAVNSKIASQGAVIVQQGKAAAADRLIGADTNETAHRIDERVP